MTFTGLIGRLCMYPLALIIRACVRLRIHPNILTFVGVLINIAAAWALGRGSFVTAGAIYPLMAVWAWQQSRRRIAPRSEATT